MTLHLTRVSYLYTLQVSDRLVSGGVCDPLANKNLIYYARDAIVTVGYAGLAYGLSLTNPDMPTDEWIVEQLWGNPIPRHDDGVRPWAFSGVHILRWLDIGQSIILLQRKLQEAINRLPSSQRVSPCQMTIAGWQKNRRRRWKPISVNIEKPQGNAPVTIDRPERYWYLTGKLLIVTPDGYLSAEDMTNLRNSISAVLPDKCETIFVENIRRFSSQHPLRVGSHCLSILLSPPSYALIRVRFIPDVPHSAILRSENGRYRRIPVAFSPWIISPRGLHSPSVIHGRSEIRLGLYNIVIEAPESETGIVGYMGSLRRPPGPR